MATLAERFHAKYRVAPSGCWIWTAARYRNGSGEIAVNRRPTSAHRVSWLLHRGEIEDGQYPRQTCGVKACVNPDHLFLRGLSAKQVREIRSRYAAGGILQRELAAEYGTSAATVSLIVRGKFLERWD